MSALRSRGTSAVLGFVLCTLTAAPGLAIDIYYVVDLPENFPSFDPDGAGLNAAASSAAQIWKQLRPGDAVYSINIHWEAFGTDAALAVANAFDGSIRFNSDHDWFIDTTPLEHSEFGAFEQRFYRDLTSAEKDNWFVGPVPDMLEYSYQAFAWGGSPAAGKHDLLSVMLHEIGHLTGIGWNLLAPDVPLDPQWIGFAGGAAVRRRNEGHIDPEGALMDPDIAKGVRQLPSALDVMVNAHERGDSEVNLQRIEYIGNTLVAMKLLMDPLGWIGGETPGKGEQATIRNYQLVQHFGAGSVDLLRVTESADLLIQAGTLEVETRLDVDGHGVVSVAAPATLAAREIDVRFNGVLQVDGGDVEAKALRTLDTGQIEGSGALFVEDLLDNQGFLAGKGGVLDVHVASLGQLDLDGSNDKGWVLAEEGSVAVHRFLKDDFDGRMRIAEGNFFSTDYYFYFGADSELEFLSSVGGGTAELIGSASNALNFRGNIEVLPETTAAIRAERIVVELATSASNLQVWHDASLSLEGEIEYRLSDGMIHGEGTLHQNGDAKASKNAAVQTRVFNWDGENEYKPTNTDVKAGVSFTIQSESIDPDDDAYNGAATLGQGASLKVVSKHQGSDGWKLGSGGKLSLAADATVEGAPLVSQGEIHASGGNSAVVSDLILLAGSNTTVDFQTTLRFAGDSVQYRGGGVVGPLGTFDKSMLQQFADARVTDHSTIEVGYFHWDPSDKERRTTVVDATGRFTIRTGKIGTYVELENGADEGYGDQIDLNGGILDVLVGADVGVDLPASWTLRQEGVMNLNLGLHALPSVYGSHLVNKGLIQGTGRFYNPLTNDGVVAVGREGGVGAIQMFHVFMQTGAGVLELELGGAAGFDVLTTNSEFHLDGSLVVSLWGGFAPAMGDVFRIIDGTSGGKRLGVFADVSLPEIGAWDVIYGDDYVDLRYTAVPELGAFPLIAFAAPFGACGIRRISSRRTCGSED